MNPWQRTRLRRIESLVPKRSREFGGKALGLAALARAGFPVPAAYALSGDAAQAFVDEVLGEPCRFEHLLARTKESGAPPVSARELAGYADAIRSSPLPAALERALDDAFRALQSSGADALAIRSSSVIEDGEATSAAGLFRSTLGIRSPQALRDAIRACWASAYTPQVLEYAARHRASEAERVGVVVQAMVPSETAGVAFTSNPLTGDPSELVLSASYGLGSSVVDGRVSPDTWRIDKATLQAREIVLGAKETERSLHHRGLGEDDREGDRESDSEVCVQAVPPERAARACLSEEEVHAIAQLALQVESHFRAPRDLEWALHKGVIFLLQSRPITAISHRKTRQIRPSDRSKIVWSNVNVGEALPGVATPLTWSVLSSVSEAGFRRAFGSLGCSVPEDAELVGSFRGRIYLNLSEFMAILSQVPGFSPKIMVSLGGGGEVERLEEELERRSSTKFLMRLPKTLANYVRENRGLDARIAAFEEMYAAEQRRLRAANPVLLSDSALNQKLRDIEQLLDQSADVLLVTYGNLLSSVVLLFGLVHLLMGERASQLQRQVLTGLADLDSAAPGLRLWHIAEMLRDSPSEAAALLALDPREATLAQLEDGPAKRALEHFIAAYGHRGPREAELAQPRWAEEISLPLVAIQRHLDHLSQESMTEAPIDRERRLRATREAAEAEIARKLPAIARPAFRHLLALVRKYTRLRERLRARVVGVLGFIRQTALKISRRVELDEPEVGADGAFYLTLEELHAFLRRRHSVRMRIEQRRRQVERDRALPNPPDTFVGFPSEDAIPCVDRFTGLAASEGVVEGRARVVHSAAEALDLARGEVLVVACADVGWAPLFLVASALVSDLGGPLSHASIVLREYGVPAVVNTKIGTHVIGSGDWVRVDGTRGVVEILERAEGSASDA